MSQPIARRGDGSSHGGIIVSGASRTLCEGKPIARVGDSHVCPIEGHGTTPIVSGSPKFIVEGRQVARTGSVTGCGASIIGGAARSVCS